MAKFLGTTGLQRLWQKIREYAKITVSNNVSTIVIGDNSITPITSHQDISGKANKSEMSVSTSGDKTTITLKSGTSATVINAHQSLAGKQDVIDSSHKLSADLIQDGTTNKAYTATEKTKLAGIAEGAEVNVQADWNQTTTTADDYIKNKPSIPDDSNLVHKTGNETISGIKTFNDNISFHGTATGEVIFNDELYDSIIRLKDDGGKGWVQIVKGQGTNATTLQAALDERNNVQSDWNQTTTTADDYIKNKPSIPTATTTSPKMNGTAAVGSETKWAKGDHVHPSDTTKADKVSNATANNLAALDANGNLIDSGVSATSAGTDTKNTTGSTADAAKLFIVGAKEQSANPQTYSQANAYVTAGKVYSNAKEVVNLSDTQALTNKTYNGYTLAAACAKAVDTSIASGSTSTNVPTSKAVAEAIAAAKVGAAAFQGTAPTTFAPTNYKKGYYWVVATAGTYAGETCESGDMIFCVADYSSSYKDSDFSVVQNNVIEMTAADVDAAIAAGSVTLITFTIDGTSYQAEEGMTWQQWVNSSYNTYPLEVNGADEIMRDTAGASQVCYTPGNTDLVYKNDVIEPNHIYGFTNVTGDF